MSRLVSRILLSIFMFPLAGIFYIFAIVVGEEGLRGSPNVYRQRELLLFISASGLTWLIVAAYWCLLWKSSVRWTPRRIKGTFLAAAGALGVGGVAGVICATAFGHGDGESFGAFIGGVLVIVSWLIATVFIWRETTAERAQRISASGRSSVACPTCGYNLTGLSESRCPECGSRFTLDELLASQPNVRAEIE